MMEMRFVHRTQTIQRIFSIVTGITIADYIRCRKLTIAGMEFVNSNVKVIDVAKMGVKRSTQSLEGITSYSIYYGTMGEST